MMSRFYNPDEVTSHQNKLATEVISQKVGKKQTLTSITWYNVNETAVQIKSTLVALKILFWCFFNFEVTS